ncbi:hypothetical protein PIIN_00402 [Serendipita indica DSM 11827]|uniref:Uncharacterized protein n=1 Tax=Serendipita indica (strain DSM 11827) TaxID=1109443 RepID=G4T5X0_SERID|nr:hypothetical protein PIIN_00402 [Serendipita indica DSM 11827]
MQRFCSLFTRTVAAPKRLHRWSRNDARPLHVSAASKQAVTDRQTLPKVAGDGEGFSFDLDYESEVVDHLVDAEMLDAAVKAHSWPDVRNIASKSLQASNIDPRLAASLLEVDFKENILDIRQAIEIYRGLAKNANLEQLPITALFYIAHLIITSNESNVEVTEKVLAELLRRWSLVDGVGPEGHFPGTWTTLRLVQHLYTKDASIAASYFRQMVILRPLWPSRAMRLPTTINDLGTVISIFTIRCCIGWRWWRRAYNVARDLLEVADQMDNATAAVVRRVLHELVDSQISGATSKFELQLSGALLCSIAQHSTLQPVRASLLRRFYEACTPTETKHPEVMSRVYLFLESLNRKGKSIVYQPPRGASLLTLLSYYQQTGDQKAARLLLSVTHKHFTMMGPTRLTRYVSLLAQFPFATEAREVYTFCEYSPRPEIRLIMRNPSVAKKLVSLFASMAEAAHQRSLKSEDDAERHMAAAKGFMTFAQHVVNKFRHRSTLLERWDHFALTTLARINFEIGFFGIGLRAMEIVSKRKDILPDEFDITILIHTLATGDPRSAFELVKYMIEKEFEPNEVAYGTVVSQAMKHGDFALVQEVRALASERGHTLRDPRVLGAVCWHSISESSLANVSIAETETRLRFILDILGPPTSTETVFRQRTLGERAVSVALRVGNPRLAYALWKRCLGDRISTLKPDGKPLSDKDIKLRLRILQKLKNREAKGKMVLQHHKESLQVDGNPQPVPWSNTTSVVGRRGRR